MNDKIDKKIEVLRDNLKFYRNVLMAIATGVVVVIYAIFNKKVTPISWFLVWIGVVVFIFYAIKAKYVELEINELIERL